MTKYKLANFGTYDIVASSLGSEIRVFSEPDDINPKVIYQIIASTLAPWPGLEVSIRPKAVVIQAGAYGEEASTFAFAGTGVYCTIIESDYKLHRQEVINHDH